MSFIPSKEFYLEVRKGNIPGHSIVHKFGRNTAVPNGSWQFVAELGQTAHILSAATTVRIKAGDAADDASGNGAREIIIQGIDDNLNEITEALTTAGGSASSNSSASFWRVHRAWVSSVGIYGAANTGTIMIENSAGGTDIITIGAEDGQSEDCVWTVPIGKTAYILSTNLTADSAKPADFRMFTRANIDDTTAPMSARRIFQFFDGILGHIRYHPLAPDAMVSAKSDIWIEAEGGGAQTEVSAEFELLIVEDGF